MEILKKIGSVALDIFVFILISGILVTVFTWVLSMIGLMNTEIAGTLEDPLALMIVYVPMLIAVLVGAFVTHHIIFKRDIDLMGFRPENLFRDGAIGYGMGVLLVGLGFGILWISGLLKVVSFSPNLSLLTGFALVFIIQSAFEEVFTRSYLIPAIEARFGSWVALVLSSLIFGLLHVFNPGLSVLAILNLFAAGVLLGLLFLYYRNVWASIGLHASWNYFQGNVFGFEVSGMSMYSMIQTERRGPDYLTGGSFGFEGSVIALTMLLVVSYYIFNRILSRKDTALNITEIT